MKACFCAILLLVKYQFSIEVPMPPLQHGASPINIAAHSAISVEEDPEKSPIIVDTPEVSIETSPNQPYFAEKTKVCLILIDID